MSAVDTATNPSASALKRIVGTGTMAGRVRSFDWASTLLGPIDGWSDTLVSAVNLVLCTPLPATLSWGERLIFFYNDATIPTLGQEHPSALSQSYREVFAEAWHLVGEDIEACYERGKTVVREGVLIPIAVNDVVEERYWTYSLIPIHEEGRVAGVFDPYQDTTAAIVNARAREKTDIQIRQF